MDICCVSRSTRNASQAPTSRHISVKKSAITSQSTWCENAKQCKGFPRHCDYTEPWDEEDEKRQWDAGFRFGYEKGKKENSLITTEGDLYSRDLLEVIRIFHPDVCTSCSPTEVVQSLNLLRERWLKSSKRATG